MVENHIYLIIYIISFSLVSYFHHYRHLDINIVFFVAGDTHVVWHNSVMTSSHPVAMEVGQGNAPLPGSPMFSSLSSAGMACLVPTCAPSVLEQIQLADISAEFGSPVSSGKPH